MYTYIFIHIERSMLGLDCSRLKMPTRDIAIQQDTPVPGRCTVPRTLSRIHEVYTDCFSAMYSLVKLHLSKTSLQKEHHWKDANEQKAVYLHSYIYFHDGNVTMVNYDVISKKCNIEKWKCVFTSIAKIAIEKIARRKILIIPVANKKAWRQSRMFHKNVNGEGDKTLPES